MSVCLVLSRPQSLRPQFSAVTSDNSIVAAAAAAAASVQLIGSHRSTSSNIDLRPRETLDYYDREPRTATSTLTQLLSSESSSKLVRSMLLYVHRGHTDY